ncbi:MAG: PAS domain S-box protein [Geobacter sp.]|nr:PAS domain S-box protein [Geobacter sp.]
MVELAVAKGSLFILCTAALLYALISRFVQQLSIAERGRTESLKSYQAIFNATDEAIFVHEARTGRILEINDRMLEIYGYTRDEALSTDIGRLSEGTPPYSQAEAIEKVRKALTEGPQVFEWHCRRKSGTFFWAEVSLRKITTQSNERIIAVVRDISERKQTEEVLRESRAKLEAALESMTDAVFISDVSGQFLDFNDAFATYHRFRNKSECARTFAEYPGFLDVFMASGEPAPVEMWAVPRALRGETATNAEYTLRRKDTGETWVGSYSFSPIRDKDGGIVGSVVVARDITDQKRSEAYRSMGQEILLELSEEENLHTAIQHVIGLLKSATGVDAVGIRLEDGDDFPYFYQEGFPQDFLQKENSLLARSRDGGVCRDDCGNVCLECTCGLVISGQTDPSNPLFTSGGSAWTNNSLPLLHGAAAEDPRTNPRDECIHQGFASVALIPIRAKGGIVGLLQLNDHRTGCFTLEGIETLEEIAENIGEAMLRKQAEEKLIASERFLRTLTDHLPGMVGYWTDDLRCSFANKAYWEWFGRTSEQLIGITVRELLGEELFNKNEPYMRRVLQGEPQQFERTLVKTSGESRYTWAQYIPDLIDGTARGFFVLISDVTELKRAEEEKAKLETQLLQAQKMESVGRLAGGVAHDFNNLLTVILGHAELALLKMNQSGLFMDDIAAIRDAAERSADLTQQLLAFARKQTIAPKMLDMNATVTSMLKMLQRLIGEDIHLNWHPAANLWQVKMDPAQIDQILANLCVNARDAIVDIGKITIETRNSTFDKDYCDANFGFIPGEYVMLAVSDDGCGMEKGTMLHIFEPFFTTKGLGEGTGLGLATVYGIVQQNNGFIKVYSEPGQGTTFKIYFSRYEGECAPVAIENTAKTLLTGQETILLVEDESSILTMTTTLLERQGYNVLAASTPSEAIELAHKHADEIRLLLTDVVMPEMNGRDLARNLLQVCPKIKSLYMSGYTANVVAHHGVLDEDVHFISKPFSLPDLAVKVREVLDA